jgi:hypothetical protein
MKASCAPRPAQQRAFNAEHVNRYAAIGALFDQGPRFIDANLGHTRMPKQFDPFVRENAEQRPVLTAKPRQGAPAAATGLEPQ